MEQLNPLLKRSLAYCRQQSSMRQLELINVDDDEQARKTSLRRPVASKIMNSNEVDVSSHESCNVITTVMPALQLYGRGMINVQLEPSPLHSINPPELKKQGIMRSLVEDEGEKEEELGEEDVAQSKLRKPNMYRSQQGFTTPPRSAGSHDYSNYTASFHGTQAPLVCHENALFGEASIANVRAQEQTWHTASDKESTSNPSRSEHHICSNTVEAGENGRSLTGSCACMNASRSCSRDFTYKLQPPPAPRKPKAKPCKNIQHKASFFIPPDLELFFNSTHKLHANSRS